MQTVQPQQPTSPGQSNPVPYGFACEACVRTKSKCSLRPFGTNCERCHRRGIPCEQPTRKRKLQSQPPQRESRARSPSSTVRLEQRLDDLMSLLRSRGAETQVSQLTPLSTPNEEGGTPSTINVGRSDSAPTRDPDLAIDTETSVVHLLRPESSCLTIADDVAACKVSEIAAEEQLDTFRNVFIPMFPFVRIPGSTRASDLRDEKPFLWLVIMSLTTKSVSQQFELEKTIWHIISHRIILEHLVDMDLLLGLVCFAAWSHYFKKETPFMNTLAQLTVALASELGIHRDVPRRDTQRRILTRKGRGQRVRNLEERRTILAVFHLTSSTWTAYRKVEPLRWTPYLDECLRIFAVGDEVLDHLLTIQVKCQLITSQLTCLSTTDDEAVHPPSVVLTTALLGQLEDVQRSLPAVSRSSRVAQFYLSSTKLTIQASALGRPVVKDHSNTAHLRRLQDLDATLTTIECWLNAFAEMSLVDWIGITVDVFAQFTQCLVVLFKLTTLHETGWDLEEVKRRADVLSVLDQASEALVCVPTVVGIVDAEGPRRGLLFKTTFLLQAIKTLFVAELGPQPVPEAPQPNDGGDMNEAVASAADSSIPDDFLISSLFDEPWFSDFLEPF